MVLYIESNAELPVPGIVELFPVVGDYDPGNAKPTDDGFLSKVSDISLGDFLQGLGFYPLSEIIDSHHQESHFPFSPEERPDYVNSPLCEGPHPYYRY